MLSSEEIKKIEDFVYSKPRSVQEIAQLLNKNWRTADRYIQEIEKNYGTITTRIFRKDTRGALKIVYWASVEKISNSIFQEQLEQEVMQGKEKEDFSAFDIYQHVSTKNKKLYSKKAINEDDAGNLDKFLDMLMTAKKQVLFFSGNLSFIHTKTKTRRIFDIIEQLVKKGIPIKVICRIDISGRDNVEELLSLNFKYKKQLIEIRNRKQPLRATIIDNEIIDIKEIVEPTGKVKEIDKRLFIFYTIRDKEWAEWMSKIFWKMFSQSIGAEKRLEELNKFR
ncbi:MAG: hypothetical protein WC413_03820 [Candidatus Nanoarchaeia archaeon]